MIKFYKRIEFFVFFVFPIIVIAIFGTFAKALPSNTFTSRDQTIYRMLSEIENGQTQAKRPYIIQIMVNSDDVLPVIEWNPDIDYYLLYPNGQPSTSPHTTKIHFDLMAHMLDTGVSIYKGKNIDHPLGPFVKPCPICKGILNNDK